MPAKLTLYPPDRATRVLVIREDEPAVIGRDPQAQVVLEDVRVSRRQARVVWSERQWRLEDLGSKNGTFVNGRRADAAPLADRDWISFGGVVGHFELISDEEVQRLRDRRVERLQTSAEMVARLRADLDPAGLLLRLVESATDLTGSDRGCVLVVGQDTPLRVEAATGFMPGEAADDRFTGSAGAIQRALATGTSLVITDVHADRLFARRQSVIDLGLATLACVPLRGETGILGLLYVDGRKTTDGFTELDLEILETLAEQAALVLSSVRLRHGLDDILHALHPVPQP